MLISSGQINTPTLYEPKEHPAGCSCAGCCKGKETDVTQTGKGAETSSEVKETDSSSKSASKAESELTPNERQQLFELQQRDSEVRAHEAAHIAAGGSAVSGAASFTYQQGPDGKLYAVGGEVPISSSGGSTPEEKIAIARQIQAGALAPANPSPQDLKVASSAALMEAKARQELAQENRDEQKDKAINTYADNQNRDDKQGSKIQLQA